MATQSQRATPVVEPYTEQEPFLWDRHRYYGFISGVGAGKTAAGVIRTAVNASFWNPGSMGAIVAPSTRMIKNAIFPVMENFGLWSKWDFSGFQAEKPGFSTPEGGRIVILSADNERTVKRLANLNLAYWWLDEARETPRRAREILQERLRSGDYRNGFITTTPNGYDHNYDFFVGRHKKTGELEQYPYGAGLIYEGPDSLCVGHVPSWANPHNPEDFKEEMRNLPDELRLQQAEGKFIEIGGGILTRDMLTFTHLTELLDGDGESFKHNLKFVIGVDPAVEPDREKAEREDTDYWAASLIGVDSIYQEAYLLDVNRKRGMSLREGVNWLKNISQKAPTATINIEQVMAQRYFLDAAKDAGLNVQGVTQSMSKEDRIIQMSIPFESDKVQLIDRDVDEALGYDSRWRPLVEEWLAFPDGRHDDVLDSVELALRSVDLGGIGNILGGDFYDREQEKQDTRGSHYYD